MFNMNAHMADTFRRMEEENAKQIRQQQANAANAIAAEQKRQADLLAQEVKRKEDEANLAAQVAETKRLELVETQRVNALLQQAIQETNGNVVGTNNITAVLNEAPAVVAQFIAANPLERAIVANALDAVKLLVENGQRYDSWADIVDEGTPLYEFLAEKFKASGPRPSFQ